MDDLRPAVARITIEGTSVRGTGFLVAPDLVATALHVVADRNTDPPSFFPGTISLKFDGGHITTATVVENKWNLDADCVLLRCAVPCGCQAIPLRELDQSKAEWMTHGFPEAQPIDGVTWAGQIMAFDTHLTDSYGGKQSTYRPVIQLRCAECGDGEGAPVRGLSGAPIIVGTSAVGLLRFALMKNGRSVAGTLYGCSAKDIMALHPDELNLRAPIAPEPGLTEQQSTQLAAFLSKAFNGDFEGLRRVVKFSVGAPANQAGIISGNLPSLISALLPTVAQRGSGTAEIFVRGLLAARPNDDDLRTFAQRHFIYALQPLDDDEDVQHNLDQQLIDAVVGALVSLAGMKPAQEVRRIIGIYRPGFEFTRGKISVLAKYKALHHCLHEVQYSFDAIEREINRMKSDDTAAWSYLKKYGQDLRDNAHKARGSIHGLPSEDGERERKWIDELEACSLILLAAAKRGASHANLARVGEIPKRIKDLLQNSSGINAILVKAAKVVQFDNFAENMRSVEQRIGANLAPTSLEKLRAGSIAVGRLRSRLAGLVAEHDEWQTLNTELEFAEAHVDKFPPQTKFRSWEEFETRLLGLCNTFPKEEWSQELNQILSQWAEYDRSEPEFTSIKTEMNQDFKSFYMQCVYRFIDVDKELNDLCGKITSFTVPLDALLDL